ncbi:secreted hydrolase [Labilithrix luteola]|uniref:Secreted hydrolase n=1 Tax=Labilithrix luteola TaxID=1391654 RepID=A0A0K1PXB8_9BACT|nr:hypothetical protein [Labilithrix luteola]AKU98180.1 secreted hydrolase [Labilithrix luteola]
MTFRRAWLVSLTTLTLVALWSCSSDDSTNQLTNSGSQNGANDGDRSSSNEGPTSGDSSTTNEGGNTNPNDGGADSSDSGKGNDSGPQAGCTGAKVCDDFESYAKGGLPTSPWTTQVASASMAIDDSKAYDGTKSVHITTNGGGAMAVMVQEAPLLPMSGNNVYGRFMMFYNVMPTTHYHLVILNGPGDNGQMTMGGLENSKALFNFGPGDNTAVSNAKYPQGKWACIQWQFDGPNKTAVMSIDGVQLENKVTNWQAFDIAKLSVGLLNCCDDGPKVDMWLDAIAIDDAAVACP